MKFSTKILLIFGVVLLFVYSIWKALSSQPQPPAPSGPTKTITTPSGSVDVRDFTQNPAQTTSGTTVIKATDQFKLIYFSTDNSFLITLLSQPLQQARDAAEAELLSNLGIDKGQACKLTVTESVPYDVDSQLAGQNYGLSFCPDSKPF